MGEGSYIAFFYRVTSLRFTEWSMGGGGGVIQPYFHRVTSLRFTEYRSSLGVAVLRPRHSTAFKPSHIYVGRTFDQDAGVRRERHAVLSLKHFATHCCTLSYVRAILMPSPNDVVMLFQRLWHRPSIETTLYQHIVLAAYISLMSPETKCHIPAKP